MLPTIKYALVVALSRNNVIGKDGKLPWHLPADLKFFKKLTYGHPLIMGRKTFASFPKPLPGRPHLVLTQNKELRSTNKEVSYVFSWEEALEKGKKLAEEKEVPRVFIIGGEQIFREALRRNLATEVFMTLIDTELEGDTFFPTELLTENPSWKLKSLKHRFADGKNPYGMQFMHWEFF